MSEPKYKLVSAESLCDAWDKYNRFFTEQPHGTLQQLAALLEFVAAPSPPQDPRDEALRVALDALAFYALSGNLLELEQDNGDRARAAINKTKELMGEK